MGALARYLSKAIKRDVSRYEYDKESNKIFLYHALEEAVWSALAGEDNISGAGVEQVQAMVDRVLENDPGLGWMPVTDAVVKYGFTPCGFEKASVYWGDQRLLGYTLVTCGGGMAYPEVATTDEDWIDLVRYFVGGLPEKPTFTTKVNSPHGCIVLPGDTPKLRWVRIENSQILPISGIFQFRKPRDISAEAPEESPAWADEYFLELEPLYSWDEGEPEVINGPLSALAKQFSYQITEIQSAYTIKAPPTSIARLWASLGEQIAKEGSSTNLAKLAARAFSIVTLPGSGMQFDDMFAVTEAKGTEGFYREVSNSNTSQGRARIKKRENQMEDARDKYPILSSFSTQALTYWWRRYIQDTESDQADTACDSRFSVSSRDSDEDFVYYMVLISTESLGRLDYILMNSRLLKQPPQYTPSNLEAYIKERVRGAVLSLAFILDEHDEDDLPEIINDWRHHFNRLVDVAVAASSVSGFSLPFSSKGPAIFSEHDKIYCAMKNIVVSYRVPRV